jgi:hypothetical protein
MDGSAVTAAASARAAARRVAASLDSSTT